MNCRKTSRTRPLVPLALLFGVLPSTLLLAKPEYTHQVTTPTAREKAAQTHFTQNADKHALSTVILNRAREQLAYIDLVLEELAQAVANNKLALKNNQQVNTYISQLRELANQARQISAHSLTPAHAQKLVKFNALLLNRLSRALAYKFRFVPKVNTDINVYLSRSPQDSEQTLDIAQANSILLKNDDLLLSIPEQYTQLGVTPRQRFAKRTIKYLAHSPVVTASKRVLPYVGLGAYYILINKSEALPGWAKKIKDTVIGQLPKSTVRHELVTEPDKNNKNKKPESQELQENTQNTVPANQPLLNPDNNQQQDQQPDQHNQDSGVGVGLDQHEEQYEEQYEQDTISEHPASDQRSTSSSVQEPYLNNDNGSDLALESLEGLRTEVAEIKTILKLPRQEKSHTEPGKGIGAIFNILGKLVGVENKPFYTITPALFFLPIIKRDLQDLSKLASRVTARITGDIPKSDALTKQSKSTFNTIVGFEHIRQRLSSATGYFKHKKLFKRTGATVDKSYLLVGSLDLGKQFAYAVAGEITKHFNTQKKNKRCSIYELHASALANKKLTQVLKDLEAEKPCVLLLHELDWLASHTLDTAIWADIQTAYAQLERKDIVIIATLESARALETLRAQQTWGVTLELGLPTDDERAVFIQKELEKYAVLPTQINSRKLAHKTAGCSYAHISRVLEKALSTAHVTRTTVAQEHIERSIDEHIYGIIPADTLSSQEKTMLAAYYAGKTIAHKHLYNDTSILKVTLLPVRKYTRQEQGALITTHNHNTNLAFTRSELEKQAIIELAGIQAQRLLLGHASRTLEEQAHRHAFAQAKASILEGISEYDLPKKAREDFLRQAWDLTTEYSKQAQVLVETHKPTLETIANKLVLHKTLSAEDIN